MSDEATMLGNLVPPFIEWKGKRYDLRYKVQRVKAHYQHVIKAKKRKEVAELAETLPEEGRTKFLLEAVDKLNKENITDDEWLLFMGSTKDFMKMSARSWWDSKRPTTKRSLSFCLIVKPSLKSRSKQSRQAWSEA